MRRTRLLVAGVLTGALAVTSSAVAGRGHDTGPEAPATVTPIAEGLAGPLQFAVSGDTVYVGQSFGPAGLLTKIRGTQRTDIATAPGQGIAGVSLGRNGRNVFYTAANPMAATPTATLNVVRKGVVSTVADLRAYEAVNNPDQVNTYGFVGIAPDCAAQIPAEIPVSYTGQVDSNPYATARSGGRTYVADAGGNTILKVSRHGEVRTVAVLPPQPLVITAELAAGQKLPACTVGLTYNFEPVPTDVEVGDDGWLYVTTLPGGPEDPSFPARGGVWKIHPHSGAATQLVGGLAGASNVAIGKRGAIYVTELFGGRVSRVKHGTATPVIEIPAPAAIEYANGRLYVSYNVFANGTIGILSR